MKLVCKTYARYMPGFCHICQIQARYRPDRCTMHARHMPNNCPIDAKQRPNYSRQQNQSFEDAKTPINPNAPKNVATRRRGAVDALETLTPSKPSKPSTPSPSKPSRPSNV